MSKGYACHPEPAKRGEGPVSQLPTGPSPSARLRMTVLVLLSATSLVAQSVVINNPGKKGTFAIRNATIVPVTSAPIANGTIVFANGVITAVGANANVPSDATVIDGTGLFVYPGLIDSGSSTASRRSSPSRKAGSSPDRARSCSSPAGRRRR